MKRISFEQACLLIGRKGVRILNEKHETITSWVMVFEAERYYTASNNLELLPQGAKEAQAA